MGINISDILHCMYVITFMLVRHKTNMKQKVKSSTVAVTNYNLYKSKLKKYVSVPQFLAN